MIAHRGASWDAPENTIPAFELAIEQGADYVEFDVRASGDGTLVVTHNPVRRAAPPDVPTLDAVLTTLRGRTGLAVEIKDEAATEPTLAALAAHEIEPELLLVLSFKIPVLELVRRVRPDLRTVLLYLGRRPDPAAATRFWGVGFKDRAARPRVIRQAHRLGLATTVYTVNDPARMRALADLRVAGIFTDRPRVLRGVLGDASPSVVRPTGP